MAADTRASLMLANQAARASGSNLPTGIIICTTCPRMLHHPEGTVSVRNYMQSLRITCSDLKLLRGARALLCKLTLKCVHAAGTPRGGAASRHAQR